MRAEAERPAVMEISKGTIVDDRYELAARLDGVGLGEAWRARDPNVASRTFTVTLLGAVAGELSAADEDHLKALRRFRHPAVLPTITQGVWAGRLYVVQGPIAGGTLREHHGEGPGAPGARSTLREVDALFQQVATAVAAAHAASPAVVHGDLHPGAVLVSAEGRGAPAIHVVGFGHGRFLASDDGSRDARFAAPERARGAPDVAGDIYALGMLLRWLLEEHDRARPSVAFADGRRGRADVPDAVWCLVERCTQPRPAERPRRVDDLLAALAPAWKGSPRPPAPPAQPPPAPPAQPPAPPPPAEEPKAPVSFVTPPTAAAVADAPLIEVATDRSVPAEAAFADVTERGAPSLPLEAPPEETPLEAVGDVAAVASASRAPASNKRLGEMRLSGGPPVPRRRATDAEADVTARAGLQTVMLGEESFGEDDALVGGRTLAREEAPVGGRTVALEAAPFGVDDAPTGDRAVSRVPAPSAPAPSAPAPEVQTLVVDEAPTTVAATSVAPRHGTAPAPSPAQAQPAAPQGRRWRWWQMCLVVAAVLAALALADALLASLV